MNESLDSVRQFHEKMGAPISESPTLLATDPSAAESLANEIEELGKRVVATADGRDVLLRRVSMALEELAEWLDAHSRVDLVAAADAWADRAYVLFGDAVATGLPADLLFSEVHRSNMTKQLDSAGSGKAVKGEAYKPPDIASQLQGH